MPAKRPRARRAAPPDRTVAIRRLCDAIAENAAAQLALLDAVDLAADRVLGTIPPATDPVGASQLADALAAVRRGARRGRTLARRLSSLLASPA